MAYFLIYKNDIIKLLGNYYFLKFYTGDVIDQWPMYAFK